MADRKLVLVRSNVETTIPGTGLVIWLDGAPAYVSVLADGSVELPCLRGKSWIVRRDESSDASSDE